MAYVRTVKTASGAIAVQIVHSNWRGSREIEHIGSAHSPGEVEVLKTVAQQRLHSNQEAFDFDDGQLDAAEAPIVASQARQLWETLTTAYRVLGLDRACPDEVFGQLVLARVVEPVSKLDSIRVLTELGVEAPSYPTIKRRLPVYATDQWRQALAEAWAAHVGLGPAGSSTISATFSSLITGLRPRPFFTVPQPAIRRSRTPTARPAPSPQSPRAAAVLLPMPCANDGG